jgi:hypothetical protein
LLLTQGVFFLFTADDIVKGSNDLGKGVYFVSNGEFEPLLYFPFELPYLFVILPVELTLALGNLTFESLAAVEQGQLV